MLLPGVIARRDRDAEARMDSGDLRIDMPFLHGRCCESLRRLQLLNGYVGLVQTLVRGTVHHTLGGSDWRYHWALLERRLERSR